MSLGLISLVGGLFLAAAVWGAIKLLAAAGRPEVDGNVSRVASPDEGNEAVLVVAPGGRLEFVSRGARDWLGMAENSRPDLEDVLRAVKPPDEFLGLCAAPGTGHFNVNGAPGEAASHRIPGAGARLLISLSRFPLAASLDAGDAGLVGPSLRMLTEFSEAITSSQELKEVLASVHEAIIKIVPADSVEIDIWEGARQSLVPYEFRESPGAEGQPLRTKQSVFDTYSSELLEKRRPIFEESVSPGAVDGAAATHPELTSYMGVPLVADGELIGLLHAGRSSGPAFTRAEFEVVQLLTGQAAPVLRNAILYEGQRRRAAQADALASVAGAITAMRDPGQLFARLVESIAPLVDAQVLGFLLYDASQHTLAAQEPFHGMQPNVVGMYRSRVDPGSPGSALLLEHQTIVTADAATDDRCRHLGLGDVSLAAGIHQTVLAPLVASGRMLGYLQASNPAGSGAEFGAADLDLIHLVADQAASIIENTRLLWLRGEQLGRAEALQRIFEVTAAAGTVQEALRDTLQELGRLLSADLAIALLLDERLGELHPHEASAMGLPSEGAVVLPSLFVDASDFAQTATGRRQTLFWSHLGLEPELLPYYRQLLERLHMESAVFVPMAAHGQAVGELILSSRRARFVKPADLDVLKGAATQLAVTLRTLQLASETDASLRGRVQMLSSVARIGRQMAASLSVEQLLDLIHEEAVRLVGADCGSVLLLAGTPGHGASRRARFAGCRSGEELSQIEQRALASREPLSIVDFTSEQTLPPHSGVKSAILVPMMDGTQTIGLLQLHSSRPVAFDAAAHEMAAAIAGHAATALKNAGRLEVERREAEALRRRADTLDELLAAGRLTNLGESIDSALGAIAEGLRRSTPFRVVLVSIKDAGTDSLQRAAAAGLAQAPPGQLQAQNVDYAKVKQLLKPEFRVGGAYYIPAGDATVAMPEIHYLHDPERTTPRLRQNAWNPDDLLLLPLEDSQGRVLGLISLEDPSDGLRPSPSTLQALEAFGVEAAQVIGNSRQMKELTGQIEGLSAALDRQQRLLSVTQNDLPVLLRKDLEQTIALHQLDQRAQRVRGGLAVIEAVSRQHDAPSALAALASATLTQIGMAAALIAENSDEGPRLVQQLGAVPATVNVQALFGQRNPLRAVLQSGEPILLPDVDESDNWRDTALLRQLRARAMICLPFLVEERVAAALLAVSPTSMPAFTDEDRQIFEQISREASVVLQNMRLLAQTQGRLQEVNILLEFSRRLTGLDSDEIVEALLESARRAVTAGQAGVVFMWDGPSEALLPRRAAGYADVDRMLEISYRSGEGLPGRAFAAKAAQRVASVDFRRDYVLSPEKLAVYREASGGRVPVSSLLVPIRAEGREIGLLMLDNFDAPSAFSAQDEALVLSLTQQAALSLENVRLFAETETLARELEQRVAARTAELSQAHRHTEHLLRQEQVEASRSGAILASVADGVVVTGPDNRITFLNASVERILGVTAEEMRSAEAKELASLFGETGSSWLDTVRRWSGAAPGEQGRESYVERLELRDGRIALVHLAPVVLGSDFLGTVSILRDITHETEVERLKSEFVATVSHELRTPMTSIKGYIEMLMMGAAGPLTDGQSQFLDTVKRNVDRLNLLVDGLLDISQLEAGRVALAPKSLDLGQIANEVLLELQSRSTTEEKPMSFSLDAKAGTPHVLGDPERVRQVVASILDNAYHYTPANGLVQVQLRAVGRGGEVQLDVIDTGIGIAAGDQERVFERFYRGEDPLVLATPGTGLGLSVAKQLVEMHRGRIWVRSDGIPGRGSTFSVVLPADVERAVARVPVETDENLGQAGDSAERDS